MTTDLLIPSRGSLLGALLPKETSAAEVAAWSRFTLDVGSSMSAAHLIYGWDKPLPTWREQWHHDRGRVPMISWGAPENPGAMTDIINKRWDTRITSVALALKALGFPVFLRWFWEMDGQHFAPQAESPEKFVAAWRHVQDLFVKAGAHDVMWVWCPNAWGFHVKAGTTSRAAQFYPGDGYVDWIAADAFNNGPVLGNRDESFEELFREFYAWARQKGKPLMVAATATVNGNDPGAGGAWIKAMSHTLRYDMKAIKALLYFNRPFDTYTDPTIFQWQLTESAQKMAEWRRMAALPYFTQR